ncbi:transposase [Avibacterium paragallinarum]
MNKNCPFCQSLKIKKYGTSNNNIQRYFCHKCHKTFSLKNKLDPIKIWTDYTSGKQTYQKLAVKYHCSVRTIQRYFDPP